MRQKIKNIIQTLLKKSASFLKTDTRYLAHGGFWLTLAQIISTGSGFLLSVAFANLLPQETYGTYKYILSILSLLSIPTLSGMNTAIVRAAARGYDGTLKPALNAKMRWGTLSAVGSLALASYYYFLGANNQLAMAFLVAAVFLPFMDSFTLFDSHLQGKKKFDITTKYNTVIKIVATLSMVATLFFTSKIIFILLAYLAPYTIIRLVYLKITLKKHLDNNKIESGALSYGFHLTAISILANITTQLDSILMWHYLNPTSLAIYAMALAPINQIKSLLKSFVVISMPKMAEQDKEIIKKSLPLKIIKSILILSIFIIALIFVLPYVYKIFFPKYLESIKYAQLLALTLILFPERLLSISTLVHANKKIIYFTNILNPAFKILLLFLLLPTYGISGAIAAILVQQIIFIFVDYYFFKKM
ncbi:MAG TPA: oligosaccharide flippase family protein [bacterium]|nr:oligosaccharide flippase family protein [bacterium]